MLMSIRLYLRLWMPTFWLYDTGCGERREKKTWSPLSFIIRFLRERMTRFCLLEKSYLSWTVSVVVSLLGDIKRSGFRNSLVSCHNFHDSAVCLCLECLQMHSDLWMCVLVCGCPEIFFLLRCRLFISVFVSFRLDRLCWTAP